MKKILIILIIGLILLNGCGVETTQEKQGVDKQEVYYELVKLQDTISFEDDDYAQKIENSFKIIAQRYEITEDEVSKILVEGVKKNWRIPEYKGD